MKIFCVGRNYVKHVKELGNEVPSEPIIFIKPSTALLLNNKPFYIPEFSNDVHYELEVVLKMKKHGKHIQPEFAMEYVDEVSLGIDFTARDVQQKLKKLGHPWEKAKAFDRSAPLGKFRRLEEIENINNLEFSLKKNDAQVQEGNTNRMIFSFVEIITHISRYFTLNKGDLIFTGTPEGVGPVQIGDNLTAYIGSEQVLRTRIL